jgi:hypothetical protein
LPNTSPHPFGSAPIHYSAPWSWLMVRHVRLPKWTGAIERQCFRWNHEQIIQSPHRRC